MNKFCNFQMKEHNSNERTQTHIYLIVAKIQLQKLTPGGVCNTKKCDREVMAPGLPGLPGLLKV